MSYAEWKAYWKTIDWSRKWFAVFLILRPLVDTFYFLKQYSALLSPVYIFGILTPLLAIASVQSRYFKRAPHNGIDNLMSLWGIILLVNALYLLSWSYTFNLLGDEIKYLTPPVVFFYLRRYIRHKDDLRFLMTNFFISCLVPFFMLGFELFVHPLTPEYVSEGRGGGTRLRGNFADSVSYGLYFIGAFITMGYFFLDKIYSKKKVSAPTLKMFAVFLICAVGIAQLRHVATWGVFVVCLTWLLFYNSQNIRGLAVVAVIALIVLPIFAEPIYLHYIEPLLRKEMNVIEGDADIQFGLNGRVSRWQRYFAIWFNMGPVAQLFGVSLSGVKEASIMVGGGMHSDYVRILFLTGIVGLTAYLVFLAAVALGWRKLQKPERFLYFTAMTALAAYSVSTLPMIYLPFINYIFPITCFALLPKKRMYDVPPPVPLKQKRVITRQAFPRPAPQPVPQSEP